MLKSKYFTIQELCSPEIVSVLSEDACWRLFPDPILRNLDTLRLAYGAAITINGNGNTYCGLRPVNCSTGALKSSHKGFGDVQGFDLHCSDHDKLRKIVATSNRQYGITRMESPNATPTWTHLEFSVAPVYNDLIIFNP